MSIPRASMQKISEAFFNLYNQNKFEIGSLYNTIEGCLTRITQTPGDFKYIMPTPDHFRDDSVISSIDDLYSATQGDEDLAGKVLYIRWYYHMTLLAMGSFAAKKVVDYINKNSDIKVNVATSGSDFRFVLDSAAKFSIRRAAGGGPFDSMYSGFKLFSPIWDDILEACVHAEDGEESLMRLEMPGAFEVFTETRTSTYWEDYVPLTDLGKQVKEHFIDEIKQIIANK
jgi:hypothetical protein